MFVTSLPIVVCASMFVGGVYAIDTFSFTHGSAPQWEFALILNRYWVLLRFAVPKPSEHWTAAGRSLSHTVGLADWSAASFQPQPALFHLLGLREVHYSGDDVTDCAMLVIPGWLLWSIAAVPVVWAARVKVAVPWAHLLRQSLVAAGLFTSGSLVAAFAFVGWRSLRAWDMISYEASSGTVSVTASGGWVCVNRERTRGDSAIVMLHDPGRYPAESATAAVARGFLVSAGSVRSYGPFLARADTRIGSIWAVAVPLWGLAAGGSVPLGVAGLFQIRRQRNRRRSRAGLCATCGYDLRSTPDGCPECGTTPSKPAGTGG